MANKKQLQNQVDDLTNKWKRALADYQNLEKNIKASKNDWIDFAAKELVLKLLPVMDHLEKSAAHLKDKGLELVYGQFKKILQDEGLEELIISPGQDFDANLMECVDVQEGQENKVLKILEKGYKLKGKVLKTARVVVGKPQRR